MTEKPIIEVKHLSKHYQIGMDRTYKRFTESVTNSVCHPLKTIREATQPKDSFWALKDVNFEVERGEVLGIIGRNGAGKSTLLKVLSRITYPTEGEIVMRGRVGSLLEVGTGFHPELTGRENIYFNGAILGMKKREIDDKFDEIVKFSGVEKFLDTPVKRYSSGMNVRLAFSVAAHLEPEILLVDEVLAVGDAEFQKKCLGKMGEVAKEGRTVLFVSHNMGAISGLCNSALLLSEGSIESRGQVDSVIDGYLNSTINEKNSIVTFNEDLQKEISIVSVQVRSIDSSHSIIEINDNIEITIKYKVLHDVRGTNIYIGLDHNGTNIIKIFDIDYDRDLYSIRKQGLYCIKIEIPKTFLNIGQWSISVDAGRPGIGTIDKHHNCLNFLVENNSYDLTHSGLSRGGSIIPPFSAHTFRE